MTDDDDNVVWIGVDRIADAPVPAVESDEEVCELCQAPVWVASSLRRDIRAHTPDAEVHFRCSKCPMDDIKYERISFTRSQIEHLLDEGATLDQIAQMFAVLELTKAHYIDDEAVIRTKEASWPRTSSTATCVSRSRSTRR